MIQARYSEFSDFFYNAMIAEAFRCADLGRWNVARNIYPADAAYCCMPI